MPGAGRSRPREFTESERADIVRAGTRAGLSNTQAITQVGEETVDIFANDDVYWRNVPIRVWEFTIGGYQVLKKWLSYREEELLGRSLTKEEAREFGDIASRIASLLLFEPALDDNYRGVSADAYEWQHGRQVAAETSE